MIKLNLTLLLVLCTCHVCFSQSNRVLDRIYPSSNIMIPNHSEWTKTHYHERISEFKDHPIGTNAIVFLGNSITEQGGDWGKRFNLSSIKNRGISGDLTEGVLQRLGEIFHFKPASVFILIGINDLFNASLASDYVANTIIKIADTIKQRSPLTQIYVQTILPTSEEKVRSKIKKTNAILASQASSKTYQLIDLHKTFADENDFIKKDYTNDGVHLTEEGYQLWVNAIKKYVIKK